MKKLLEINNLHVRLSILLYLACFFFPAYYGGSADKAITPIMLLLLGWLGLMWGIFSWFANPLFVFALLSKDPDTSSVLVLIAFFLAIFVCIHPSIFIFISADKKYVYDWGYSLWVMSFAILYIGQRMRFKGFDIKQINLVTILSLSLFLFGYSIYYFFSGNSAFSIQRATTKEFEKICASAGEHIFKRTNDVQGIFFEPEGYLGKSYLGRGYLEKKYLSFYETNETKDKTPQYKKYTLANMSAKGSIDGISITKLDSEYAVITEAHEFRNPIRIGGETITIKDLRNDEVIATSTYYYDRWNNKFCGKEDNHFSESDFITEVLGLKSKYPIESK